MSVKILVVEDEMIVALDLQIRLKRQGYCVPATAITGEEALELTRRIHPDLIFMDIGLKGSMDGIQAAEQILAQFAVPVVFLTAFGDETTRRRAEVVVPAAFLTKPFADDELNSAISAALAGRT